MQKMIYNLRLCIIFCIENDKLFIVVQLKIITKLKKNLILFSSSYSIWLYKYKKFIIFYENYVFLAVVSKKKIN